MFDYDAVSVIVAFADGIIAWRCPLWNIGKYMFADRMACFCTYDSDKEGVVTVIATIADGWHLYGMKMPETGPKPTQVKFELPAGVELTGKLTVNRGTVRKYDDMFGGELEYWGSGELKFTRHFKITKAEGHIPIKCMVSFMGCNDETCLPPQLKSFNITLM